MSGIKLGQRVRCFVTEISGIVTVVSEEMNGNRRITVQQKVKDDGALPESYAHDQNEVEFVSDGVSDRVVALPDSPVQLGVEYRDKVSGFVGIATGRHTYLSGCLRFTLTAKAVKGIVGKFFPSGQPETIVVDHAQLEPVKAVKDEGERVPEVVVPRPSLPPGGPRTRSSHIRA